MKKELSKKQVKRLINLMSVQMTQFDCGRFCAGKNQGVPLCCDQETVIPLLFQTEYRLLNKRGKLWKKMPVKTRADKELVKDLSDHAVFCLCDGVKSCKRSLRSLACRAFPFEPFVDSNGKVLGIVYQHESKKKCPLIGKPASIINPAYIRNSIIFWQELIDAIPDERELYIQESRKRQRRAKRKGKKLMILGKPSSFREKRGLSLGKLSRLRNCTLEGSF